MICRSRGRRSEPRPWRSGRAGPRWPVAGRAPNLSDRAATRTPCPGRRRRTRPAGQRGRRAGGAGREPGTVRPDRRAAGRRREPVVRPQPGRAGPPRGLPRGPPRRRRRARPGGGDRVGGHVEDLGGVGDQVGRGQVAVAVGGGLGQGVGQAGLDPFGAVGGDADRLGDGVRGFEPDPPHVRGQPVRLTLRSRTPLPGRRGRRGLPGTSRSSLADVVRPGHGGSTQPMGRARIAAPFVGLPGSRRPRCRGGIARSLPWWSGRGL